MTDSRKIRTISTFSFGAVVVAAGIALACADAPTKPAVLAASRSAVMATRGVTSPLIDDASGRLAAAVDDAITRGKLRKHLGLLSTALDEGDSGGARRQIALIRKLIAERESKISESADLAGVALALDQIESQLDAAMPPRQ